MVPFLALSGILPGRRSGRSTLVTPVEDVDWSGNLDRKNTSDFDSTRCPPAVRRDAPLFRAAPSVHATSKSSSSSTPSLDEARDPLTDALTDAAVGELMDVAAAEAAADVINDAAVAANIAESRRAGITGVFVAGVFAATAGACRVPAEAADGSRKGEIASSGRGLRGGSPIITAFGRTSCSVSAESAGRSLRGGIDRAAA
jgi:hypothetical protein